jgi:hypothetical protein
MEKLFDGKVAKGTFATTSTAYSIPLLNTPRNMSSATSRNTSDSDVSESGSDIMIRKRQKKLNPIEITDLLLTGIADLFTRESFLSQAMSIVDINFRKYDGRQRVAIKKLFQIKETAEYFKLKKQ